MRRVAISLLFTLFLPLIASAAGDVDILWQGLTYTPPLYEGRSLWTNQTDVRLVAIPHIPSGSGEVNPSTLIYKWSKDGVVLGSLSGVNKRTLTISDTVLSLPVRVRIDILTEPDTDPVTSTAITLTPTTSELLVYEDNPLLGLLFNRAIGETLTLTEPEITLSAFPFFAGVGLRIDPKESYTWTTNAGDSRRGNKATYRVPEGATGSSVVTVEAANSDLIAVPPVEKSFLIQFDNQSGL